MRWMVPTTTLRHRSAPKCSILLSVAENTNYQKHNGPNIFDFRFHSVANKAFTGRRVADEVKFSTIPDTTVFN